MNHQSDSFITPFAWVIAILLLICEMVSAIPHSAIPAVFPFIQKDLGLTRAELGLIPGVVAIVGAATVILNGWLTDVWGARRLLLVSIFWSGLCVLLFSQMYSLVYGVIFGVMLGAMNAAPFPAAIKGIVEWFSPRTRALGIGIMQVGVPLAGGLSAIALPSIAMVYNWRVALIVVAGATFIIGALVLFFYREKRSPNDTAAAHPGSLLKNIPSVFRDRDIMLSSVAGGLLAGIHVTVLSFTILFLTEDLLFSSVKAGVFFAIAQLSTIIARVAWGAIGAFLGGRLVVVFVAVGLSASVAVALMATLSTATPDILVALLMVVIGFSVGSWVGPYATLVASISKPRFLGISVGVSNTLVRILVGSCVPLFGLLVDSTNSYQISWVAISIIAIIAVMLLRFLHRETRQL